MLKAHCVIQGEGAVVSNTPIEIVKIDHHVPSEVATITLKLPIGGKVQQKDVRLDLGKRQFVDSVGDPTIDHYVRAAVDEISGFVVRMIDVARQAAMGKIPLSPPESDGESDDPSGGAPTNGPLN